MLFIVIYRPPNSHAELYSRVQQLKSDLKNLEASIEQRITQSNVQHGDRSTQPDNETKKNLEFLSNSYDDLSNFRKTAKIEFERLDKRLDCLEAKVDGILLHSLGKLFKRKS